MKLTVQRIGAIESAMHPNSGAVTVECQLTDAQMFDALCLFCERITDAQFEEWVAQLRPDATAPTAIEHEEKCATIRAMLGYGGSFIAKLADAWAYADPQNAAIIEQAFARVIAVYRAHARQAPRMVA